MKPYTKDALIILADKIFDCLYSWYQNFMFVQKRNEYAVKKIDRPIIISLLGMYYLDHFFHELSELYTAFYKKGDQEILGRFNASEDQREKLKNVRHPAAHVTDDIDAVIRADREMYPSFSSGVFLKDLILMTKHIRLKLKSIGADHDFIKGLRALIALYPPDFNPENVKKDLLGDG